MSFQLPHIISWAHRFVSEVLAPGDLAVDLTAGRGRDSLVLYRAVGEEGCVLAFDIQNEALKDTAALLEEHGAKVTLSPEGALPASARGVWLAHDDHAALSSYLPRPPRGVIANLGYLPGGDLQLVTRPESTRAALEAVIASLPVGGRLVCVVYIAHPGGTDEAAAVEQLLGGLSSRDWFVLRLQVENRHQAPYLLVAEKRR